MNATQTDTIMKEKIIMQIKEIISSINHTWTVHNRVHRLSLLHEHSKVFKIIYTNRPGNVLSGKRLSEKVIVRETSVSRQNNKSGSTNRTAVSEVRSHVTLLRTHCSDARQ